MLFTFNLLHISPINAPSANGTDMTRPYGLAIQMDHICFYCYDYYGDRIAQLFDFAFLCTLRSPASVIKIIEKSKANKQKKFNPSSFRSNNFYCRSYDNLRGFHLDNNNIMPLHINCVLKNYWIQCLKLNLVLKKLDKSNIFSPIAYTWLKHFLHW